MGGLSEKEEEEEEEELCKVRENGVCTLIVDIFLFFVY